MRSTLGLLGAALILAIVPISVGAQEPSGIEPVPDIGDEVGAWPVPATTPALVISYEEMGPDWEDSVRGRAYISLDGHVQPIDVADLLGFNACPAAEWMTTWMDDVVPGEGRLYARPTGAGARRLVMDDFGWGWCLATADVPLVASVPWRTAGGPLTLTDLATGQQQRLSDRVHGEHVWAHAPSGQLAWREGVDPTDEYDTEVQSLMLFDARTGSQRTVFGPGEDRWVGQVAWSSDGSLLAFITAPPPTDGGLSSLSKIHVDAFLVDLPGGDIHHTAGFEAMPTFGFDTMSLSTTGELAWVNSWADEPAEDLDRLRAESEEREMARQEGDEGEDGPGFEFWQRLLVISPGGSVTDIGDRVRTAAAWAATGELLYVDDAGNLKRWADGMGAEATGHQLESPMYDTAVPSPDARFLAITNGWSYGPDDPLKVMVYDVESDRLDETYQFDGVNAWGSVWWWPRS